MASCEQLSNFYAVSVGTVERASVDLRESGLELTGPKDDGFLDQVLAVVVATTSDAKLAAVCFWLNQVLNLTAVGGGEIPISKESVGREEPEWQHAVLVASDKVEAIWAQRTEQNKKRTLFIGSDVVVSINGQPLGNLSRQKGEQGYTGADIDRQKQRLIVAYCGEDGAQVVYDIATAVKYKDPDSKTVNAATGVRVTLKVNQIPREAIKGIFSTSLGRAENINSGLPLVDSDGHFYQYIESASIELLMPHLDNGGMTRDEDWSGGSITINFSGLNNAERQQQLYLLELLIRGGIPLNIASLFNLHPNGSQNLTIL